MLVTLLNHVLFSVPKDTSPSVLPIPQAPVLFTALGVQVPFVTMSPSLLLFSYHVVVGCSVAVLSVFSSFSGGIVLLIGIIGVFHGGGEFRFFLSCHLGTELPVG